MIVIRMEESAMTNKVVVEVDSDLADLVPKFLANRHKDLLQIGDAIERSDNDALRTIGHNMKGVGGGYGFAEITELGKRIETAAKNGDQAVLREQLNQYKEYLANVEVRYV
jgi:HPt (histidine-containing phosphotransfer) domain-containing protein